MNRFTTKTKAKEIAPTQYECAFACAFRTTENVVPQWRVSYCAIERRCELTLFFHPLWSDKNQTARRLFLLWFISFSSSGLFYVAANRRRVHRHPQVWAPQQPAPPCVSLEPFTHFSYVRSVCFRSAAHMSAHINEAIRHREALVAIAFTYHHYAHFALLGASIH